MNTQTLVKASNPTNPTKPTNPTTQTITPEIKTLIETIFLEIKKGHERAVLAVEQEKRLTYWTIGKHIKTHLLQYSERADYGKYLFNVLAQNLSIDRSTLYRSMRFYEEYPSIVATWPQLTWSHIKVLLGMPEKEAREKYEKKIIEKNLSVRDLRYLIKKDKELLAAKQSKPPLIPRRDKPYIYMIKTDEGKVEIDLGFRIEIGCPFPEVNPNTVIHVEKNSQHYTFIPAKKNTRPHYTYKAKVLDIIDGDTFWAKIDLGFKTKITQKLRIKGINAEAIETPGGQKARDYLVSKFKGCKFVAIKSYWRDKFDRYLVDVFYDKNESDFESLIQNGTFLNQDLLDKGLAVRY